MKKRTIFIVVIALAVVVIAGVTFISVRAAGIQDDLADCISNYFQNKESLSTCIGTVIVEDIIKGATRTALTPNLPIQIKKDVHFPVAKNNSTAVQTFTFDIQNTTGTQGVFTVQLYPQATLTAPAGSPVDGSRLAAGSPCFPYLSKQICAANQLVPLSMDNSWYAVGRSYNAIGFRMDDRAITLAPGKTHRVSIDSTIAILPYYTYSTDVFPIQIRLFKDGQEIARTNLTIQADISQ